jgi:hypothetical protein
VGALILSQGFNDFEYQYALVITDIWPDLRNNVRILGDVLIAELSSVGYNPGMHIWNGTTVIDGRLSGDFKNVPLELGVSAFVQTKGMKLSLFQNNLVSKLRPTFEFGKSNPAFLQGFVSALF